MAKLKNKLNIILSSVLGLFGLFQSGSAFAQDSDSNEGSSAESADAAAEAASGSLSAGAIAAAVAAAAALAAVRFIDYFFSIPINFSNHSIKSSFIRPTFIGISKSNNYFCCT